MNDWKESVKAIREAGERALEAKKEEIAVEKEEKAKTTEDFIRVARPYLEDVVDVYKKKDSTGPAIREKVIEFVGTRVECDLALYMRGGSSLCLRSFKRDNTIYFSATGYIRFRSEGKRYVSHHTITVTKPDHSGNTVFTLKDEHIREAIQKFLGAYHENIQRNTEE